MEAQVWTLIGLLGATLLGLLGSIFHLGQRMDGLRDGFDVRFDRIDARFDAGDSRTDGLATRMDVLSTTVENQGRMLGERIYELATKLDEHLRRHAS